MNLSPIIRKARRFLFYSAVFAVAIDILGGVLFAIDSLGSAAAFTVGTAVMSAPLWGLQAVLALFQARHYSANEWFWSLMAASYMTLLIIVFVSVAMEANFP